MKRTCRITARMLLWLRILYRSSLYLFFFGLVLVPAGIALAALPDGFASQDIGDEGLPGSADLSGYIWTVSGSGRDIGGGADGFHFCYMQVSGDTEIEARVVGIIGGTNEWRKAGVMIRETLADNSSHAFMAMTNPAGTEHAAAYQSRAAGDNSMTSLTPTGYSSMPWWVRLHRDGDNFTGSVSPDGVVWTDIDTTEIVMGHDVYIGLAVTSHDNAETTTGTFDNVMINGLPGPYCPGSWSPVPANRSFVAPEYDGTNVYMILDFTPGTCARQYWSKAYFSDNRADVDARDEAHSLGTVPPWPDVDENAFVVGYDDPGIPEYARVPLVLGMTYYWCVDSWDGARYWPGYIFSFTLIPEHAWNPSPADGEECVSAEPTCTWHLGDLDTRGYTLSYNVYCGTDEAAVAAIATGSTAAPQYKGNVATETIVLADLNPETEYFWRVDTKLKLPRPPFSATYTKGDVWSFTTNCCCMGGILREWWTGIPGSSIADLTNDPNYPDNPDGSEIIPSFEGPIDFMDHYGSRLHGWLYVTQTGEYMFSIATYYAGELWLSTDSNPANATVIASIAPGPRIEPWIEYPVETSDPITLVGGQRYYISALMRENLGEDAVAWQGPDTGGVREIISGLHLIPYVPVIARNPYPPDRSVYSSFDLTLTWDAGIDQSTDSYYTTQHVYVGNDPNAVAEATTASPEYMGAPTGPNEYGPVSLGYSEFVYWRIDGVSADTGTVLYPGSVWRFESVCCLCPPWEAGLKLRLKFENNAFDSSGHGNDGTEIGGPTYVAGADGQAIHLDGIDDYVDFEHAVGISGDEPRTIAGWVKADTTSIPDWTNVFGFIGPAADGTHFDIEVVGDTNSTTTGWYGLHLCGEQYNIMPLDLEWHHLAATFDGTTAYFYADAVLLGFATPTVTIDTHDNVHVGKRDDNDNYFPGSIDDVRIYDTAMGGPHIAAMIDPRIPWTWTPNPGNGAVDVPPGQVTLSWQSGACAADVNGSVVYYGEDLSAVTNRTAPSAAVSGSSFILPMTLDLGRTLYWVVDAVNGPCTWPGNVWTFTTANWLSVDDMESYTPWTIPGNNIFEAWRDGPGNCSAANGNNTGSVLTENGDPVLRGGIQSMKYEFDNDGTVYNPCTMEQVSGRLMYSKIEAQVSDLPSGIGSDWTAGGVRALTIPFMGRTGNPTTESCWVQLQDGSGYGDKVFYGDYAGESLDDFNDPNWHEWNIDLAEFNVDLNDVVSIVIGIGSEDETGDHGSGTLYLDDIRLYIPRCVPNRSSPAFAALDYAPEGNRDCVVNYQELAIMARDWLQSDKTIEPQPITSPANIIDGEGPKNLKVNFRDYAELAASWLETEIWPF
jgi:regulation of enolase protein 1 (concanavalin A-like superfamily)